jgi:LacI family transcriptional regulator
MMHKKRPTVGIVVDAATGFGRQIMRGVMRYANTRRRWRLLEDFRCTTTDPASWPRCDGAILSIAQPATIEAFRKRCRHVVSCSGGADPAQIPVVCVDDVEVGRIAARHLLDCRLEHFAFYGSPSFRVSDNRLQGFTEVLARRGRTCTVCPVPYTHVSGPQWMFQPHWPALIAWLKSLPKPTGILAMDDTAARELVATCLETGIAVPDQIAIIGVNNDDLLCESAWPPISSIEADFARAGYAAARILDRLLGGEKLARNQRLVRLPPIGVVRRTSTDMLAVDDPHLAAAVRFIRERACDPCSVPDILAHVPVGRRWLEQQFVQQLGRTPHAEIVHARMEVARRLMVQTDIPVPEVAHRCGFSTVQSFNRVFRNTTEESPAAYRRVRTRGHTTLK